MWVTFQLQDYSGKIKKFQIASTDMRMIIEDKEGVWERIDPLKEPKRKLAGFCILRKHAKTGLAVWATFDPEGKDFKEYPEAHPLLFPADFSKLPAGTRVELHLPEEG